MGTRNLTCVVRDGKFVVAQYCQWDGYPAGQGVKALDFMRQCNLKLFRERLSNARFIDEDELQRLWKACGADDSGLVSMEISQEFCERHPTLHRDTGADVLNIIYRSNGEVLLQDDHEFAGDSLFCEWCYVIDLDKNTFEVYGGFSDKPLDPNERFYFLQKDVLEAAKNDPIVSKRERIYYPIRILKSYPLDALPTPVAFVNELEPEESTAG